MFFINLINQNVSISTILVVILSVVVVAMFSIMMHEIAHGYVALKCGDYTAKSRGRLTLNPKSHFDLVGILMLMLVGFGWAKPVPIDTRNFKNYKKNMIAVSLAGVTTNLVLALISMLLLFLTYHLILPSILVSNTNVITSVLGSFWYYLLLFMIQINLMLAFFNLLPVYPLDGYNLVSVLIKKGYKFKDFMIKNGFFVILGLIIGGRIFSMIGLGFLDIFGLFGDLIIYIVNAIEKASILVFMGI